MLVGGRVGVQRKSNILCPSGGKEGTRMMGTYVHSATQVRKVVLGSVTVGQLVWPNVWVELLSFLHKLFV